MKAQQLSLIAIKDGEELIAIEYRNGGGDKTYKLERMSQEEKVLLYNKIYEDRPIKNDSSGVQIPTKEE